MNKYIESINDSKSMNSLAKAKQLKEQGVDIISLGGGDPDFDTPISIINKSYEELKKGKTHYLIGKGLPELRNAITNKLKKDNNIIVSPNQVLITPGAKMAIYLSVRTCINEGDEVLIPTPAWNSYFEIVKASGGIPVEIPLNPDDNYSLKVSDLEDYYSNKTKMLIISSPNNPTGRVLTKTEIENIISFIKDKDIITVVDEIYEQIFYDTKPISLASYNEVSDKVITVNGFSKTYAMTGWRIGYLVGPIQIVDLIYKLYAHTVTCVPPFIQEAALFALNNCQDDVINMRNEYKKRRDYFVSALNNIDGIDVINPEGAFYVWCKFNFNNISEKLLDETRIIGVGGNAYGSTFDNYIRFSFATDIDSLKEAASRLKYYLNK